MTCAGCEMLILFQTFLIYCCVQDVRPTTLCEGCMEADDGAYRQVSGIELVQGDCGAHEEATHV